MPKIVDHDAYRREMLDKSLHLFSRKGYASVTMREIAAEVGVSTGTIYHYFPTKESILTNLLAHILETNVGDYLKRIKGTGSTTERLAVLTSFLKDHAEEHRSLLLLAVDMYRNDRDGSSQKMFWAFSETFTHTMADRLELTHREARSLFIYILGILSHTLLTPDEMAYDEEVTLVKSWLETLLPMRKKTMTP